MFLPEAKSFFIIREALLEPFGVHLGVVGLRQFWWNSGPTVVWCNFHSMHRPGSEVKEHFFEHLCQMHGQEEDRA